MRRPNPVLTAAAALAAVTAAAGTAFAAGDGFTTTVKPYLKPIGNEYSFKPLLSAADKVPLTGDSSKRYQMIGIPDGLGARELRNDGAELFMNHELVNTVVSEPVVGGPLNRGAFVSRYHLSKDAKVRSGKRAYDTVYKENDFFAPAPDSTNTTPGFGRFCSGELFGTREGLDRPIYFTGEEGGGASTFDGKGGQSVAVFGNRVHTLPKMGRFPKENTIVARKTGNRTVAFPMEDGPTTPDSQLWMYVGEKHRRGTPLARNGLDNGKLYVFVIDGAADEGQFTGGTKLGRWVEIPGAEGKSEAELEAAADAVGAFGFIRVEDAASGNPGELYFVTTGGNATKNLLGRAYRLKFDPRDPTDVGTLKVIYNADQIVAAGGDTAVSPDNIDVSNRYLMIQEDGTAESRPVMGSRGRDGSIWRFDLKNGFARRRVAQLNPPGRDGVPVGPGVWESSGIIDASSMYGKDSWLTDVQAHPPTAAPAPNTVEDGQLLLMRPKRMGQHR